MRKGARLAISIGAGIAPPAFIGLFILSPEILGAAIVIGGVIFLCATLGWATYKDLTEAENRKKKAGQS